MKGRNKTQKVQVMHHPLSNAHHIPKQPSMAPGQPAPVFIPGMIFHGEQYPFGPFRSAVAAVPLQDPRELSQ